LKVVRGLTAITPDVQIDKMFGNAFNPWGLRRRAHVAIDRGLLIPAGAEFSLTGVDDPYGFASAGELSLFRSVLPSTNLRVLATAMFDECETHASFKPALDAGAVAGRRR
jgi:hypothetical protein